MTTGSDTKKMHPGAKFSPMFQIHSVWGIAMMDGLEYMKRSIRPYETVPGRTEEVFADYLEKIARTVPHSHRGALKLFEKAVEAFNEIPLDRSRRRPRVGIVGEILLNYHPVSNGNIEKYLEENGMEVVIPSMLDFFRRSYIIEKNKAKRNLLPNPLWNLLVAGVSDKVIALIKGKVEGVLEGFRFSVPSASVDELVGNIEDLIDVSYIVGEGWLMPAEIIQMIKHGVGSFVIVQPFGCLPNHITGRGMVKSIKSLYPQVQILSLDYDPDTSFANVENRLQMLIITAKELHKKSGPDYVKAS
jgi:predicted nucleotide-binding protein (sugar kinase/HSP70/actin superfamily)